MEADERSLEDVLRDYAEYTAALDEMQAAKGWQVLVDRMRLETEPHRSRVLGGNLTQEEYRYECGWLAGALAVVNAADRIRKEYVRLLDQKQELALAAAEDE